VYITPQDVFRYVFWAAGCSFVLHFVLCRVFALCILCCVAFSLRLCVLCCVFASCFDTFPEPQPTLLEPMPTLLEPQHTFPEPKHSFSEPQYVPICRMYVTALVNMLLLYVLELRVVRCTFRLYEILIL